MKKLNKFFYNGNIKEGIIVGYVDSNNKMHYNDMYDGFENDENTTYYVSTIVETINELNEKEYIEISDWRNLNEKEKTLSTLFPINTKIKFCEYKNQYKFVKEREYFLKN